MSEKKKNQDGRRIYISGRIGADGVTPEVREKFARAEKMLKELGYTVINPASEWYQNTMNTDFDIFRHVLCYESILYYDLGWLCTCTAIYLFGDWKKSPGATTELCYALATGKKIFCECKEDALCYCNDVYPHEEIWLPIPADN